MTLVGKVVKPHGIRGEVVVEPFSDRPERFAPETVLETPMASGESRHLVITGSRPHKGRLLVAFDGVADRTEAEALRDHDLHATVELDEDPETYLTAELVDMPVAHEDGRDLGRVVAVVDVPAAAGYDLLEVERDDGTSWLLPAVEDYVVIDEAPTGPRLVLVSPPEGLVTATSGE